MNLHQLFLADLGPELQLTAETLRQASFAVRRNRNEWLLQQRTRAVIEMIAHTADQWLEPENQFRILALRDGPHCWHWLNFSGRLLQGRRTDQLLRIEDCVSLHDQRLLTLDAKDFGVGSVSDAVTHDLDHLDDAGAVLALFDLAPGQ